VLISCQSGAICVYQGINDTFWLHNHTLMSVTNGSIFNAMMKWLPYDNATHPTYEVCTEQHSFLGLLAAALAASRFRCCLFVVLCARDPAMFSHIHPLPRVDVQSTCGSRGAALATSTQPRAPSLYGASCDRCRRWRLR